MESVWRCISHDREGEAFLCNWSITSEAMGSSTNKWYCSHIAAILYCLETAVRISEDTIYMYNYTSKPNTWLCPTMPRACQQVPFVTMEELEKIASQRKQNFSTSGQEWKLISQHSPSEQKLDEFYEYLSKVPDRKPAMLSLIPQYSEIYAQSFHHLPTPLHSLYEPQNLHLN